MLALVLVLMVVFGIGYVVLGAGLDTPTAWSWLSTVLRPIIFVVHAAIFDPLRILFVAFYWTVFRHQLMP